MRGLTVAGVGYLGAAVLLVISLPVERCTALPLSGCRMREFVGSAAVNVLAAGAATLSRASDTSSYPRPPLS